MSLFGRSGGVALRTAPALGVSQQPPMPLTAFANFDPTTPVHDQALIKLTLNRPLAPNEGDLVLVGGGVDVTAVSERSSARIRYRPAVLSLPAGDSELILYRRSRGQWSEIRRFALRVLNAPPPSHA